MTVSLRVLAVDDEPLILMSLVDMLEDLGHQAMSAASGEEAIALLKSHQFDVLLTDQSMPRMRGDQLIQAAMEIAPALGVILTTGYSESQQAANGHVVKLAKPYSERELATALQELRRGT